MTIESITSWDAVESGREFRLEEALTGWRYSTFTPDGELRPFLYGPYAQYECTPPNGGRAANRRHTGVSVHPECTCGLSVFATETMARSYQKRQPRPKIGSSRLERGQIAGFAICEVFVPADAHVTGPPRRRGIGQPTPSGAYRAEFLFLTAIHLPAAGADAYDWVCKKYPTVDVHVDDSAS